MNADSSNESRTARVSGEEALALHAAAPAGKLATRITKPLTTARDLSLAYSPGVAYPCLRIEKDPSAAFDYTSKGNFVAVVSNGTAVLGLGDLGALAAKPVMEGKAALFKRFADIDSIDLAQRYAHEILSYTALRLGLSVPFLRLEGKSDD